MRMTIFPSSEELAQAAAHQAAGALRNAISLHGSARLIAATGVTQFRFLELLTALPDVAWENVELFHLDEYLGLTEDHPASFCRFLRERLITKTGIRSTHLLDGSADPQAVIRSTTEAIRRRPVDLAFLGIGVNGHLAFNDPPADFTTDASFTLVDLDQVSRRQQFAEGWFASFEAVPKRAISMTIPEIMRAEQLIVLAPEQRKADAIARCFQGDVSPLCPASILRKHPNATLHLDGASSSRLSKDVLERYTS